MPSFVFLKREGIFGGKMCTRRDSGGRWRKKVRIGEGIRMEGAGSNLPEFWSRRTYTPEFTESIADVKWGNHPPPPPTP